MEEERQNMLRTLALERAHRVGYEDGRRDLKVPVIALLDAIQAAVQIDGIPGEKEWEGITVTLNPLPEAWPREMAVVVALRALQEAVGWEHPNKADG